MEFTNRQIEKEAERLHWQLSGVRCDPHNRYTLEYCSQLALKTLEIQSLKQTQNAILLAHSYVLPEIVYGVADFKSLEEVRLAIELGANRLLLDNMDNEMLKKCLSIIPESIETEASGNMNLERLRALNEMPLNFISVGALTHSAPNADFSLLFDWSPTK